MFLDLEKIPAKRESIKVVPEEAGIYIFWQNSSKIYIGKAVNLKRRLESYFATNLTKKTAQMVSSADSISFIRVVSEIEALLLEAKLVRKFQPKYNIALKDDKHPLYILITKEKYPRVLTVRKVDLGVPHTALFGPFPSTRNLVYVLKMVRSIFPFSNHLPTKKPCLYSQFGLCVPCPSLIENTKDEKLKKNLMLDYKKNLKNIRSFLNGRLGIVRKNIERDMKIAAREENFEKADKLKSKLRRVDYITTPLDSIDRFIENPNLLEDIRAEESESLKVQLNKFFNLTDISRIECFDIAHIAGEFSTASMVTFESGEPNKNLYRHFRIRHIKKADDIASLSEVAKRREKYLEKWGRPDLIIVDGGKAQAKTFYDIFKKHNIAVVGLAKRFETIIIPKEVKGKIVYDEVRASGPSLALVKRIRDEAHRFARRYHHKLFKNYLLQTSS